MRRGWGKSQKNLWILVYIWFYTRCFNSVSCHQPWLLIPVVNPQMYRATVLTHWCHSNQPVREFIPFPCLSKDSIYIPFPNLQLVVVIHVVIVFVVLTCQGQKITIRSRSTRKLLWYHKKSLAHTVLCQRQPFSRKRCQL